MTQEEKELLLKDLCARLPYEVKCLVSFDDGTKRIMTLKTGLPNSFGRWDFYNENCSGCSNNFKPYLRPMSSMTEEEKSDLEEYSKQELDKYADSVLNHADKDTIRAFQIALIYKDIDWYNKYHFDYRGLIPMGLALEAPEDMYN